MYDRNPDVWKGLAAPLPAGAISWRQDGRPTARDGKFFARFVAYIEATTVFQRLDEVVPGEWNLTLELLPRSEGADTDGNDSPFAFKARLQVLGVVREDVGTGKDYKQASTDAFKRVAVRFGIGTELYSYGLNWVPMDGDSKYAKPLEDPNEVYQRRTLGVGTGHSEPERSAQPPANAPSTPYPFAPRPIATDVPPCPKCAGKMWDNRIGKRNPRAPDFKCRDRGCDGVVWPSKPSEIPEPRPGDGPVPEDRFAQVARDEVRQQDEEIPF